MRHSVVFPAAILGVVHARVSITVTTVAAEVVGQFDKLHRPRRTECRTARDRRKFSDSSSVLDVIDWITGTGASNPVTRPRAWFERDTVRWNTARYRRLDRTRPITIDRPSARTVRSADFVGHRRSEDRSSSANAFYRLKPLNSSDPSGRSGGRRPSVAPSTLTRTVSLERVCVQSSTKIFVRQIGDSVRAPLGRGSSNVVRAAVERARRV
jgi:hypothetical protein